MRSLTPHSRNIAARTTPACPVGRLAIRFLVAVLLLSMTLAPFACKKEEREVRSKTMVREEGKAPDFTLNDIHGVPVKLSDLRGKVVLLEFWATWCPPCKDSIPALNMLYGKLRDRNFQLLAVSVDEGSDALSMLNSFARDLSIAYTVLLDRDAVSRLYDVSTIPVMFLIDKEGRIVRKHFGYLPANDETLLKEIEAIL